MAIMLLSWATFLSALAPCIMSFIIFLVFVEQTSYLRKKGGAPGPVFVPPFIGNAISLVREPTSFWDTQSSNSSRSGFSANYIMGRFMLYIGDTNLSHLVFSNVRPDAFLLVGHPFGKKLFGEHNLIYMSGQEHKDLRRRIAPNFTPRALSTYTSLQQIIILKHLKKWESLSSNNQNKPISLRMLVRDMNLETSQTVFVGPYLSEEARERFKLDYNLLNVGLMKLPIDFPGFAFHNARLAVDRLAETLSECVIKSKTKMDNNHEPSCLIDFWMQEMLKEIYAAKSAGEPVPPLNSDAEIGGHLFDFLFAAQDASTSSLLWAVALLDSHPEVLLKVREEVSSFWSPGSDTLINTEKLREMKYTQAVAREVLRYRAPVTLVPHIAVKDFALTESYTIPKGTIVFPSVLDSSFQGFTDPDRFDPDRPSTIWFYSSLCSAHCLILRGLERTAVMISFIIQPSVQRIAALFPCRGGAPDILISLWNDRNTPPGINPMDICAFVILFCIFLFAWLVGVYQNRMISRVDSSNLVNLDKKIDFGQTRLKSYKIVKSDRIGPILRFCLKLHFARPLCLAPPLSLTL